MFFMPCFSDIHRFVATKARAVLKAQIKSLELMLLVLCFLPAVSAKESEPVYVDVRLQGAKVQGEHCSGGDWSLHWKGPVQVESGPLTDLLNSYTAFDTTQPGQTELSAVNFNVTPVECRGSQGEIQLRAITTAKTSNQVQLTVSLANNPALNSPAFVFSASDIGQCKITTKETSFDYDFIMAGINSSLYNSLSPALNITQQDLEQGFNKSYSFSGMVAGIAPLCMGSELQQGSVRIRYKSDDEDPAVTMDACLHLAKNERRVVTATGTPQGGHYSFSANPDQSFALSSQANQATVTGNTPGTANLQVEYQYKNKTASATVAGSVVELITINNGSALPKLGLYDAEGKSISSLYSFPLKLNPANGLVQMTLGKDSLASVINTSAQVQIQPVKTGKTVLQAKTMCGTNIGEPVPVEIVRCDDQVQQQLKQKQQEYKNRLDHIVRRITQTTADSEFNRAATEIADTTKELAIKTGETIIGTLSFGESQQVSFAAKNGIQLSEKIIVNAKQLEVAGTLYDSYNAVNDAQAAFNNPGDMTAQAKMYLGTAVLVAQNSAIALGKTYGETYLAAQKFGQDLGILAGVAEQLANLEPQHDQLIKEYLAIIDHTKQCAEEPVTIDEPKPLPREPETKPEPAPGDEPVDEQPVPDDDPTTEPPTEEEPPSEQPPVKTPPKKVYGLACRIQDLRAPQLAFQLRQLQTMVQQGAQQIVKAQAELSNWQNAINQMKAQSQADVATLKAELSRFKTAQETFLLKSAELGHQQLDYLMDTEECPEKLEVKFDQIRAHYN